MDEQVIHKGWLTISSSPKRELKRRKETTAKGRTPLGDKGLGRLGAQRLGLNVEIFTKTKAGDRLHHVGWSWNDFRGDVTLARVPVQWDLLEPERKHGTTILISDLREPDQWDTEPRRRIVKSLSQMISPYSQFREFEILGSLNGTELELGEMSDKLRQSSQLHYRISFDEAIFRVTGRAKTAFLRPSSRKDQAAYDQLVEEDGGQAFFEFLSQRSQAKRFQLQRSKSAKWFAEFVLERPFDEIDGLVRLESSNGAPNPPVSPGPFTAEIDGFSLGQLNDQQRSTFDSLSEYRALVKELSGVRIYRDGFGVRVDRDWLGLGAQWTAAGSYYGLKPENTLGFVALTARDNAALVETTDREGFKDTPAYRNFLRLFVLFREFAHDAQEFMRRAWTEFRNEHEEEVAGIAPGTTAEDLAEQVTQGLRKAADFKKALSSIDRKLTEAQAETKQSLDRVRSAASRSPDVVRRVEQTERQLMQRIKALSSALTGLVAQAESFSTLVDINSVLQSKLDVLRTQLAESVETMSLGLTAEALSHEIANITDHLSDRTKALSSYLVRKRIADSVILGYCEHVRSIVNGLRTQIGHLSPSLKFARTRREELRLLDFFQDLASYHKNRWRDEALDIAIEPVAAFVVRINQGKLTQVFDNLILNSEYWLREDLRSGRISRGLITIRISNPHVTFQDNGQGIDPSVETTLFEPFVTCRKGGRGLGLYVVQQLLDSEGCAIKLRSRRNKSSRAYQFELDFSGCISDADN